MKVNVRIFGNLAALLGNRQVVELNEGATVATLSSRLAESAGLKRQGYLGDYKVNGNDLAILVNGRNIRLLDGVDTVLRDRDEVVILPPTAGG
jgi:molybdopterin synthase sulfur carrier subunit